MNHVRQPLAILPEDRKNLCTLLELVECAAIFLSKELYVFDFNQVAKQLYDWKLEEILHHSYIKWCADHDIPTPITASEVPPILNGKIFSAETYLSHNQQTIRWKAINIFDKKNESNDILLIGSIVKLIDFKEKIEDASIINVLANFSKNKIGYDIGVHKSPVDYIENVYSYLDNIISNMPCYVYWKNKEFTYLGCNDLSAKLLHLPSRQAIVGKTDYDFGWEKTAVNAYRKIDEEIIKTGEPKLNFYETIHVSGRGNINLLVNKMPIFNAKKEVVGIVGISVEVAGFDNELSVFSKAKIGYDIGKNKSPIDYISTIVGNLS